MPQVKYVGPFDEVEVPALGLVVKRGDTIDVSDEVAGRPPTEDDLGEGLLAQSSAWQTPGDDDPRTVPELKAYADEQGIDLGGATKKAEILTVIRKAETKEA